MLLGPKRLVAFYIMIAYYVLKSINFYGRCVMVLQKRLISSYVWALSMAGLIVLSWKCVHSFENYGVLVVIGNILGILGLIFTVNHAYKKGKEDKSIEIANETVKTFLRNAQSRSPATKKTPSISHLRKKWDPFIDTHLHLVVKKP